MRKGQPRKLRTPEARKAFRDYVGHPFAHLTEDEKFYALSKIGVAELRGEDVQRAALRVAGEIAKRRYIYDQIEKLKRQRAR